MSMSARSTTLCANLPNVGWLTAVAHQRVARGGMRTVYRITPRGRDRFRELLHAQFAAEGDLRETLYGPMLFLHLADLKLRRRGSAHPNRQAECAAGGDPEIAPAMGNDATYWQPPPDAAHGGAVPPRSALAPRGTCRCGGRTHSRYPGPSSPRSQGLIAAALLLRGELFLIRVLGRWDMGCG